MTTKIHPIREGEKGAGAVWVASRVFSRFARVLLACMLACMLAWASLYGVKKHMTKHVARPSSPSIARKSDFCLKKEVKWCNLSVRHGFRLKMETRWRDLLFTRRFSFKKETLWHDLPAKFYECGASSKKEGGGNGNSCYISIEQWEIHVKS